MTAAPRKPAARKSKQPERGIALTGWLALLGILSALGFLSTFRSDLPALSLLTAIILAMLVYGLWNWQRWAYWGIMTAFALVVVVALLGRSVPALLVAVLVMLITAVLIQPRIAEFR